MGQLVPACRENPGFRKPVHLRASPESSGHRDKALYVEFLAELFRHYLVHYLGISFSLRSLHNLTD
jgi:hypothetical protein